eukprot:4937688-Amphidinium_carterae.1
MREGNSIGRLFSHAPAHGNIDGMLAQSLVLILNSSLLEFVLSSNDVLFWILVRFSGPSRFVCKFLTKLNYWDIKLYEYGKSLAAALSQKAIEAAAAL